MLFCHITTLIEGEPHGSLLVEKSGSGLPHVAILDAQGRTLAVHEGEKTVDSFVEILAKAKRVQSKLKAMRTKAEAGDASASTDLLEAQVSLHHLKPKQAIARLAELQDVSEPRAKRIKSLITKTTVIDLAGRLGNGRINPAAAIEEFATYRQASIESDMQLAIFWQLILYKAAIAEDLESSETAVEHIKQVMKALGLFTEQLANELDKQLASLRGS